MNVFRESGGRIVNDWDVLNLRKRIDIQKHEIVARWQAAFIML